MIKNQKEIKFTEKMLDDLALARRCHSFGDDFKNYITNYLVEVKKYEYIVAALNAEAMAKVYFDNDRNLLRLWQDRINDTDGRDVVISLLNDEYYFDTVYFKKGKPVTPYKSL